MNEQIRHGSRGSVALFITCLVDLFRPSVGFAAVQLLEQAGYRVDVPEAQTCCGQPAYNSGDSDTAAGVAAQVIRTFSEYDYVVVPSGSCAATIIVHYPDLLRHDPALQSAARDLADRTWELTRFLAEVADIEVRDTSFDGKVAYHDSCSGLRELGIREQPRELLAGVHGLRLQEMEDRDVCCGFGGTFCVKYPEISERMVDNKLDAIRDTGASTLLSGDLGCLLNMAGRMYRRGMHVRAYHVAEVLAGMGDEPAIGEGRKR